MAILGRTRVLLGPGGHRWGLGSCVLLGPGGHRWGLGSQTPEVGVKIERMVVCAGSLTIDVGSKVIFELRKFS